MKGAHSTLQGNGIIESTSAAAETGTAAPTSSSKHVIDLISIN